NQAHLHAPGVDSPPLALPGYPLLIAGLHALGLPLIALLLLQVAMGGAATWLAYAAADGLLNSRRCGLIAAAVVGLHPASVLASGRAGQQRAPAFVASRGVHGVFARLGLSAPEGVGPVVLLPLMEPARLLAVRDVPTGLALAWTAGNVLLLAATILGAVLLLV